MSFGNELFVWRKSKGKTQAELAAGVGVNVSYISNLERDFSANTKSGKPRPSVDLVDKIAKFLDVDINTARLAAGYAPNTSPHNIAGFMIELPDDVEMVMPKSDNIKTQEDANEFRESFLLAYEITKKRLAERKAKEIGD